MQLYPLKFVPRLVPKMWGGRVLETVAHKSLPPNKPIGESWELYDFAPGTIGPDAAQPGDEPKSWISSTISNGPLEGQTLHAVMLTHGLALLGGAAAVQTPAGPQFPLLIKFLDARQDLSVQVHPPASYAAVHPGAALKNECWHVLAHEPGARILIGTKPGTTRAAFEQSIKDGRCEDLLNAVHVKTGDTFYLPSGTVHALGSGIVAAEVQTPSDTTYRVYDFKRDDPSTGKPRALHIAQAMECIDFETDATQNYVPPGENDATVVHAPQFTLKRRSIAAGGRVTLAVGEMRVIIVIEGSGDIGGTTYGAGETILVPASVDGSIQAQTKTRWLEATVTSS